MAETRNVSTKMRDFDLNLSGVLDEFKHPFLNLICVDPLYIVLSCTNLRI